MRNWVLNGIFVGSIVIFIIGIISIVGMFNLRSRYSLGYDKAVVSIGESIEMRLEGYDDKIDPNMIEWQIWGIDNCSVEVSEDKSKISLTGTHSGMATIRLVYQGGILGKVRVKIIEGEYENTLSEGGVFG